MQQDFKEVTAGFSAEQITTQRSALRAQTKVRLQGELGKYGIQVVDFFVTNLDYTQSYKDAISAKNVQVQQALQAQAKVAQSTAEAEQNVARAKGEAEAVLVNAEAAAKSLRIKAAAIRVGGPAILQLERHAAQDRGAVAGAVDDLDARGDRQAESATLAVRTASSPSAGPSCASGRNGRPSRGTPSTAPSRRRAQFAALRRLLRSDQPRIA